MTDQEYPHETIIRLVETHYLLIIIVTDLVLAQYSHYCEVARIITPSAASICYVIGAAVAASVIGIVVIDKKQNTNI